MKNGVTVTIDKPRILRVDMNSVWAVERETGQKWDRFLESCGVHDGEVHWRFLGILLWASLLDDDPKLTLRDVGRLLTGLPPARHAELSEAVNEAWRVAGLFGKEAEAKESPFSESDGSNSGPSRGTTSISRKKNSGG